MDADEYIAAITDMVTEKLNDIMTDKVELIFQYDELYAVTIDELLAVFKKLVIPW